MGIVVAIWSYDKNMWKYKPCEKFHCMVVGHVMTDFWMQKMFWFRTLFFYIFSNMMEQKKTQAQKILNIKNQFLHTRQSSVGILDVCSHTHLSCIFTISCQSFQWLSLFNFENWCLKMKSWGLYHAYILGKSGLISHLVKVNLI